MLARPWSTALVAFLVALHGWLAFSAAIEHGPTFDEPAHITGGYAYWTLDDYRLQPENGNLPQRWAALPLLWLDPRPILNPTDVPSDWSVSYLWLIARRFFYESGNSPDLMLAVSRAAMTLWTMGAALLVFFLSRGLWGERGALLSLTFYAFSPITLAHGPLATSDMVVAVWLLAAAVAYWRHLHVFSSATLCGSAMATALAAVSKFSFLLLPFVFLALVAARLAEGGPWKIRIRGARENDCERLGPVSLFFSVSVLTHLAAAFALVWMAFGFRFSGFNPEIPVGLKYYAPWSLILPESGALRTGIDCVLRLHVLPEAYVQGFCYMRHASQARAAFLDGNFSPIGWWYFFPLAFLYKSTLAEIFATVALLMAALVRLWRGGMHPHWRGLLPLAPILALGTVYGVFSLTSNLNIGHRHILPLYLLLFIVAGWLARSRLRTLTILAAVLGGLQIAESTFARPHYLAHFNRLAGGPENGWRHLVDSSLDWGQELPGLARWLREHRLPHEKLYLSYTGTGNPDYEGIPHEPLAPPYYNHLQREWNELGPGLYAMGATALQDVYSPWAGKWTPGREYAYHQLKRTLREDLAAGRRSRLIPELGSGENRLLWDVDRMRFARLANYLRLKRPEAVIGHSLFVFRLDSEEVRVAVDGSSDELADLMEKALSSR